MISYFWWSWILTVIGLTGFFATGWYKRWWGWIINIGVQALWVWYALTTHQYGFIVSALLYAFVFGGSLRKALKERRPKDKTEVVYEHDLTYNQAVVTNPEVEQLYDHLEPPSLVTKDAYRRYIYGEITWAEYSNIVDYEVQRFNSGVNPAWCDIHNCPQSKCDREGVK